MASGPITAEVSRRICLHMNNEHSSSLFKYAVNFGGINNPKLVEMIEISEHSMVLNVDGKRVLIDFDRFVHLQ